MYVTDRGMDCVENYNGQVDRYMKDNSQAPVSGPIFNAQHMQVATGDHATQTMNVGPDVGQVLLALQGLVELMRGQGLFEAGGAGDPLRRECRGPN
jgi:hypothetical protein